MNSTLLVFDSHPVQYRVPVWQAVETICPGSIHVVYASDCSVRGFEDEQFGKTIAWDEPLLSGYSYSILNCEKGKPLSGWRSLTGAGVSKEIEQHRPSAILLTGINYQFDLAVYYEALKRGIPVWLRCESQDEAFQRGKIKSGMRSVFYRVIYAGIAKFFYIGKLNRSHYLAHGVSKQKLLPAHYCTVDRFEHMSNYAKNELRFHARNNAGVTDNGFVIGFSGKFISKKNPALLFEMLPYLPSDLLKKITLYFVGSGELENELKSLAQKAKDKYSVNVFFAGFINQTKLPEHYLAMDILVLPSQRMGETWGLVANEAMQAGCSVIVSDAVGCSVDFKEWERFRVFKENDAADLAINVVSLSKMKINFDWASEKLKEYTIQSAAQSLASELLCNYTSSQSSLQI
jgi:glycosyltransferase involved in cell wall biosynthesis